MKKETLKKAMHTAKHVAPSLFIFAVLFVLPVTACVTVLGNHVH